MNNKLRLCIVMALALVAGLTSCEKHDGVYYSKNKCVAELNNKTYIDQSPISFNPDVYTTPYFLRGENHAEFNTHLKETRNGEVVYYVKIVLYTNEPSAYLYDAQTFQRVDTGSPDEPLPAWEYAKYCRDNQISYARVNDEIVEGGTFKITSYNKEKDHVSHGTFTLTFSEGTLKGKFF